MKIIICLDDRDGYLFMKRRQSRDSALCNRVLEQTKGAALWMNSYSAPLFSGADVCVDEAFLEKAGVGDFCFVENCEMTPYLDRVEEVWVYRWNRHYPADTRFPMDVVRERWILKEMYSMPPTIAARITASSTNTAFCNMPTIRSAKPPPPTPCAICSIRCSPTARRHRNTSA